MRRGLPERMLLKRRISVYAAVDPPFVVHGIEEIRKLPDSLRRPEKQDPPSVDGVVQQVQDFLLQLGIEVDEQVTHRDDIHPGIRVLDH